MPDDDPVEVSARAAVFAELGAIFGDACVVSFWITIIVAIEYGSHVIAPPSGPVFFSGTRFEFPLQWMIDTAHILNFGGFVLRTLLRTWRQWWRR